MSILDTFFFMFDADASKLEKGLDKSNKKTDELEKNLKDTDAVASSMGKTLNSLAYSAGAALGGILSIGAIGAMTLQVADFVDTMGDAADAIGIGVDQLHAWELAVQASDGEQGAFTASLNQFNVGLNMIATTGKGRLLPFLKELGLDMDDIAKGAKDPTVALVKMSDQFAKLSKAEAAGLGAKIGLDQGTINLLTKGREGVEALIKEQRELGVITKEDAELAGKFDLEMKKWNAQFATVKREVAMTLIPALTWTLGVLRDIVRWMSDNRGVVVTFFTVAAAVLAGVYAPAALAAAAATWALIAPYVAIGAAVAAFAAIIALVAEDLYQFQSGNDSVTGEIVKRWEWVGTAIKAIGSILTWLLATSEGVFSTFVALITQGPQAAVDNFAQKFRFLISEIAAQFPLIGTVMSVVFGNMTVMVNAFASVWDWLIGKIRAALSMFATGLEKISGLQNAVGGFLGFSGAGNNFGRAAAAVRASPLATAANAAPTGIRFKPDPLAPAPTAPVRPAAAPKPAANPYVEPKTAAAAAVGKQQVAQTNSPIAAQSSSSISNSTKTTNTTKETKVDIAKIEVHTQATDGDQVASAIGDNLGREMRQAIDQNDDGVAA